MNRDKIKNLIRQSRNEKTWQFEYKELESKFTEKSLDYVCEHIEFKENLLNDLYVQAYNMQHELNNLDFIDMDVIEAMNTINNFMDKFEKLEEEYGTSVEKVTDNLFTTSLKIKDLSDTIMKRSLHHVSNNQDFMILIAKVKDFQRKMANMTISFGYDDLLEGDDIFRFVRDDLKTVYRIINKRYNKESNDLIKEYKLMKKEHQKYLKIFDYKDMVNLALNNGYKQERVSGDHLIYKNREGVIVPIPAHELGYGLMIKIQKQIYANKSL